MKRFTMSIISTLLVLLLFSSTKEVLAQRVVKVVSGVGTLNQTVNGDTTATGARKDTTTIYELDKNGYYVTLGTIENRNYHLRIRAAAGAGSRPIIRPGVVSGGSSSRPFSARGDLTLDGVYFSNLDEQNGIKQYVIQIAADNVKLTILNSQIDREGQIAIRCDGKKPRIVIKNSIISNVGTMNSASNGRGVDDRGNDIDTLIYENNTFYNLTSRILRDGGGVIKYCRIDHNTVVNSAQQGCSIGPVITGYFTNNLFFNAAYLGKDSVTTDWFMLQTAPLSQALRDSGFVQKLAVHHNNFYVSPEIVSAYPTKIRPTPVMDSSSQAAVTAGGWGSTITNLSVSFNTAPQVPVQVMKDFYDTTVTVKTEMDRGGGSPDFGGVQMPFNFSYLASSPVYTGAEGGYPLGDLNWFPALKDRWERGLPLDVTEAAELPESFFLEQNYPNPFNPTTTILYSVPKGAHITLEVFDILGRKIATLVDEAKPAGEHRAVFDASRVSSGVYVCRLTSPGQTFLRKMTFTK